MSQPLAGFRVVDFSHVMAGPFASHFLRLLGAEVIKIEPPGRGDLFRNYRDADDGMSPAFIAANAGKQSLAVDLKSEGGREVVRKLIASADVVIENFRPGVIARLGFGYEACKALKPDLIFCSISGYGQEGPMRDYPAIDNVVQATSGMMSVTGERDGPPMRMGVPAVDTYVGTLAAMAIQAALLQRERFGGGQYIDQSMLDASLVLLTAAAVPYLVTGRSPERTGNTGYSAQPTAGMFACADGGQVSLGVVQQNQFDALARALERPEWLTDPRFATGPARMKNAAELTALLDAAFLTRTGEDWEARLSAVGAPCGLVRDIGAACELEQLDTRGLKLPVALPGGQQGHVLNAGFRFAHDGPGHNQPPPRLGEHSLSILKALGYGEAEAQALVASGAIEAAEKTLA